MIPIALNETMFYFMVSKFQKARHIGLAQPLVILFFCRLRFVYFSIDGDEMKLNLQAGNQSFAADKEVNVVC